MPTIRIVLESGSAALASVDNPTLILTSGSGQMLDVLVLLANQSIYEIEALG
jgi:hypothetical protein